MVCSSLWSAISATSASRSPKSPAIDRADVDRAGHGDAHRLDHELAAAAEADRRLGRAVDLLGPQLRVQRVARHHQEVDRALDPVRCRGLVLRGPRRDAGRALGMLHVPPVKIVVPVGGCRGAPPRVPVPRVLPAYEDGAGLGPGFARSYRLQAAFRPGSCDILPAISVIDMDTRLALL